jgi:hypothetical protein
MSKRRLELEAALSSASAELAQVLEPLIKRRRKDDEEEAARRKEEEATIASSVMGKIKDLEQQLAQERARFIFAIRIKGRWDRTEGGGKIVSCYDSFEEAEAQCPRNSQTWEYSVDKLPMNRLKKELVRGDDPPSK